MFNVPLLPQILTVPLHFDFSFLLFTILKMTVLLLFLYPLNFDVQTSFLISILNNVREFVVTQTLCKLPFKVTLEVHLISLTLS